MEKEAKYWILTWWILGFIFLILGLLNLLLIHPVPGFFYFLISIIYLPPIAYKLKQKLGFTIPKAVKIILALFIIWASLAVGDLMELFESTYL